MPNARHPGSLELAAGEVVGVRVDLDLGGHLGHQLAHLVQIGLLAGVRQHPGPELDVPLEHCVGGDMTALAYGDVRPDDRIGTDRDVAGLVHFVDVARQEGQTAEQGLQLAIQAMLVSPNFLFRVERDAKPRDPSAVHAVTDFELASRLSYFLWSSMPDDALLDLAQSGKLHDAAVLDQQVKRMLADERSAAFAATRRCCKV